MINGDFATFLANLLDEKFCIVVSELLEVDVFMMPLQGFIQTQNDLH